MILELRRERSIPASSQAELRGAGAGGSAYGKSLEGTMTMTADMTVSLCLV